MDIVTYILSKKYVDNAIFKELSSISSITFNSDYKSFSELPTEGHPGTIYLIPIAAEDGTTYSEEYIFNNGQYKLIGTTQITLDGNITDEQVALIVQNVISKFIISGGGATVE